MMRRKFAAVLTTICLVVFLLSPYASAGHDRHHQHYPSAPAIQIDSGETWVVEETTQLSKLTIAEGAQVTAPEGYELTLTVNGVETGGVLVDTYSVDTEIAPGIYRGAIVLTVTEENIVEYVAIGSTDVVDFPFRQALYLDEPGIVEEKSVLSAVVGKRKFHDSMKNMLIRSDGENFNGIFAAGGTHTIKNSKIDFSGNGRSDFAGYGAAAMSTGEETTLVLDQVKIVTDGVVRTAAIADNGSNLVVKNSYLQTYNGILPEDYVPTIDMVQMRSVPWMLGLAGNNRATNLLGNNTKASYINSYIGSEGWGVLSTDDCTTPQLTAINSTIANIGEDGYGSYGIGDATERFLGCTFDVATYATICRDTVVYYGDSDPEVVAQLNTDLELGLTARELRRIKKQPTIVNSDRFGIMWHGGGTVDISGGTIFNTGETTFLSKGQAIALTVDGSEDVLLYPGNGVILQVMDDDDPGAVFPEMTNTGVYEEPEGPVTPQDGHDIYTADDTDALATFTNIAITGDFYNAMRGDIAGPFGPASPKNMGLTFDNASVTGMISASEAHHHITTITAADFRELGMVTNTPGAAVNNGVIVTLANGSEWSLTGTCYLTKLTIDDSSLITPPDGAGLTMTIDGIETAIEPDSTYEGAIVIAVE